MCIEVAAFVVQMHVADTHMADNALVEGAICETIDLRRSVIFAIGRDNLSSLIDVLRCQEMLSWNLSSAEMEL